MKTYKESKAEIKKLVIELGINGIYNYHLNALAKQGHTYANLGNALNYFMYSPKASKYR